MMLKILLFSLSIFSSTVLFAQEEETDWKLYRPQTQGNTKDSVATVKPTNSAAVVNTFNFATAAAGTVNVKKDPRIDALTTFLGTPQNGKSTVTVKGFRVQIFTDRDKNKVNQRRADYLAFYAEQPAYIDFLAPNFRLRVGNFRTKLDASYFQNKIKPHFPDAVIVMDDVELPKLP
jgi:hypothetical protein